MAFAPAPELDEAAHVATPSPLSPSPVLPHRSSVAINVLPLELLIEIVSYTHLKSRTGVLALVCKRWRMAALRSIQRLVFSKPDVCPNEKLTEFVALVPSLTDLTVFSGADAPRSLRSLCIVSQRMLDSLPRGDPLPHLTTLYINDIPSHDLPHFIRFVHTHTRLTALGVGPGDFSTLWTALEGVAVRKLCIRSDAVACLKRLIDSGRFDSLELTCSLDTFLSLPAHCVGDLISLTLTDTPRTADRRLPTHFPDALEQLCHFSRSLTSLTFDGSPSDELLHVATHRDLLLRTATVKAVGAERWPDVCLWRRVETLRVMPAFTDSPLAHRTVLPHLREVQIGSSDGAVFDAQRALALAADFLRTHTTILHIRLHVTATDSAILVSLRALIELAVVCGLRQLSLHVPHTEATLEALCHEVTMRGWLRTQLVVG